MAFKDLALFILKDGYMNRSDRVAIKTRFRTVEQCREECVDGIGIKHIAKSWSNKLYGIFDVANHFKIASDAKGAALFVFEGVIIEREDGIYMEGNINVKPHSKKIVLGSILMSLIAGIILITTFNIVLMFMGILFMIVPWFNYTYMKKSDVLYKMIHKKVS